MDSKNDAKDKGAAFLPNPSPSGQQGGVGGAVTSPSQPAGSRPGTGDAGSEKNLNKINEAKGRTAQQEREEKAKTEEVTDKETGIVTRTLEDKEGNKTIVSAVTSEDADKHIEKIKTGPTFENQTQSLLGVPGNVNLTRDGTLAGDKSIRDERTLEEINAEIEDKAGPNPMPNREGNELTHASNFMATAIGTDSMGRIDRNTNAIARELKGLSRKDSLSQEDKDRLEEMSKQLELTGKV